MGWWVSANEQSTRRHLRDGEESDSICGHVRELVETTTEELPECRLCLRMVALRERAAQLRSQGKHSKAVWG